MTPVYVLGGSQTDFALRAEGLYELVSAAAPAALDSAGLTAEDVQVLHVGNLAGELFAGQALLGGLVVAAVPGLDGVPSTRHEAACASGSTAVLAAWSDLAAGRYDVALVVGVELMRNVSASEAAAHLGSAAWAGREALDASYPWPALFAEIADAYDERHGLDPAHLGAFARQAYANAARNPLAQARSWTFGPDAFGPDDEANPVVAGRLRKTDCGRITDGAAAVVLASPSYAAAWAAERGIPLDEVPALTGFGHRTATLSLADKLARHEEHMFPHLAGAVADALGRAGLTADELDVAELHDCFSITALVAVEHLGLDGIGPGQGGKAIADGAFGPGGRLPVNPGGGLLALGHPVGATGVRMLWDAARQVSGRAGGCQTAGARRALTVNVGGSFTSVVCLVVTTRRVD